MKQNAPIWVKIFVGLHIFAITAWCLPKPPDPILNGTVPPRGSDWLLFGNYRYVKTFPPLIDYLMVTGFWQYWDMFAPNPASADFYADAIVTYRDGSTKIYNYPRIEKMPVGEKYVSERYRKFFERVRQDEFSYLWPAFGQVIAQKMDVDPKNPPVSVKIRRNWIDVQPPGTPQWKSYRGFIFFDYIVDQRALALYRVKQG